MLPEQSPLHTSLKPYSKKGTNLGPQTAPYKPKLNFTQGTGTTEVSPTGEGSQGCGWQGDTLSNGLPTLCTFSSLETFPNWVLTWRFHPFPCDQRVRAKPSRGESQGEAPCRGHGAAALKRRLFSPACPCSASGDGSYTRVKKGPSGFWGHLMAPNTDVQAAHVSGRRASTYLLWQGLKPPSCSPALKGDIPIPLPGPPPQVSLACTPREAALQAGPRYLCPGIWAWAGPSPEGSLGCRGTRGCCRPGWLCKPGGHGRQNEIVGDYKEQAQAA